MKERIITLCLEEVEGLFLRREVEIVEGIKIKLPDYIEIDNMIKILARHKEETRTCSECGSKMREGYVIRGGDEYYCSDTCLHKHYSHKEWLNMYDGETYYTAWE